MKVSQRGLDFIAKEEGIVLKAYRDIAGILTIGVGHTSAAGPPVVSENLKITKSEAMDILSRDIQAVERQLNSLIKVQITQSQYDAIASFVFNVGGGAFKTSTLLKKLNARDYSGAMAEFAKWNKITKGGKKVAVKALSARRAREADLFESDGFTHIIGVSKPKEPEYSREEIRSFQKMLDDKGYHEIGFIDGLIGRRTEFAIGNFQRDNQLPITGEFDERTVDALRTNTPMKPISEERAKSNIEVAKKNLPEVVVPAQSGGLWAKIGVGSGGIGLVLNGILDNVQAAREQYPWITDVITSPWLAYAIIAGLSYMLWRKMHEVKQGVVGGIQSGKVN